MNTIETLTEFLGWCTVINTGLLLLSTAMLMTMRGVLVKIHAKMTGVSEADLLRLYLEYLGNYKILIIILNLVPYITLRIMA